MNSQDPYNRGGYLAFLASFGFSILFFGFISFVYKGPNLNEVKEPVESGAEQVVAKNDDSGPVDISGVAKPWEPNELMVKHGKNVFSLQCAVCHGAQGHGDGPAGAGLNPRPRNLVEGHWKKGGDSIALYETLLHGIPGSSMASFAHLPKADRWALVQFIHSITQNVVKDDSAKLEAYAQSAK